MFINRGNTCNSTRRPAILPSITNAITATSPIALLGNFNRNAFCI